MARATALMDGWEWIAACPKCAALMTALVVAMVALAADACAHRAGRLTTAACRATSVLAPRVAITTASARVVRACATRASGAPSASSCCARTTATIEAIARRPGDACATAVGAERAARSAAAARASCGRMGAGTCAPDMGRAMSTVCANATLGGRDSAARRERVGILTLRDLDSAPRPESTSRLSQLFTITNGPVSGLIRHTRGSFLLLSVRGLVRGPPRGLIPEYINGVGGYTRRNTRCNTRHIHGSHFT